MTDLAGRVRALGRAGLLDLPPIGGGRTAERWAGLAELARHDVAEARIALFSEAVDTDGALEHLDQAIFLLQRLSAHGGRAMGLTGSQKKTRSA